MTDLLLAGPNIPPMFGHTLFKDFDVTRRRTNKRILRQLEEWVPTDEKPALLLQGEPGVGKTMLAAATLNEYHGEFTITGKASEDAAKSLLQMRLPLYFIQVADLIHLHLRLFRLERCVDQGFGDPEDYLELDRLLQDLRARVQVLVLDDVGKEHRTASGFAVDEFDLLVRTRHNNGLTTIYTTNIPLSRWSTQYSESMANLIRRSSLVLDF